MRLRIVSVQIKGCTMKDIMADTDWSDWYDSRSIKLWGVSSWSELTDGQKFIVKDEYGGSTEIAWKRLAVSFRDFGIAINSIFNG